MDPPPRGSRSLGQQDLRGGSDFENSIRPIRSLLLPGSVSELRACHMVIGEIPVRFRPPAWVDLTKQSARALSFTGGMWRCRWRSGIGSD